MTKSINQTSQFNYLMLNWTKSPIRVVSSPRKCNLSQFIKLIKLNLKGQFTIIQQQKTIDQFWKKIARTSKNPNFMKSKNSPLNAWKMKRNWKRKGIIVLPVLEDKTLEKKWGKTTKKFALNLDRSKRVRKAFENFWNSERHMREKAF